MIRPSGGRLVVTVRQDRDRIREAKRRRTDPAYMIPAAADFLVQHWLGQPMMMSEIDERLLKRLETNPWKWTVPYPKGHPRPPSPYTLYGYCPSMEEAVTAGLTRLRQLYTPPTY